jgi:peptidoglycan/xylan/chitin deacetylase (PgdA/CDA1 family)
LLPARRLWSRAGAGRCPNAFRILTLHHVPREHFAVLERLLDYLLSNHRFLTPAEAEQIAMGEATVSRDRGRVPYLLTFDDGFQSNFEVARSLLAPRGIRAIFFVLPNLIDAPGDLRRQLTATYVFDGLAESASWESDLMSWEEIGSLREQGHSIGSHTLSHRRLSTLGRNDLVEEIAGSAARLRAKIGEPIHWFAYPFGTVDSISPEAYDVVRSTYRFCCSAVRGLNERGAPLALFRENVELQSPLSYQKFECEGGLDMYYAVKRARLRAMLPRG